MWLLNDRIIMNVPGATTEVATLKQALSEAENNVAQERTEREKQEARVGEVQQDTTREKPIHRILPAALFKIPRYCYLAAARVYETRC